MQTGLKTYGKNDDQRAYAELQEDNPEAAETLFKDPEWQAVSKYRSGNYDGAAEMFISDDSIRSQYNLGNSLALSGQIAEAIETYDQVLEQDPDHEDARFNRDLLDQLMQQMLQQAGEGESNESEPQAGEGNEGEPQDESATNPDGQQEENDQSPESDGEETDSRRTTDSTR